MILVDANILLYAENADLPQHEAARGWWDGQLSSNPNVCLCWPVLSAYLRISTNLHVFPHPLTISRASERIESWLSRPNVRVIQPTSQHWAVFRRLLSKGQASGNLVSDAHIAAIAMEHGCELYSTDADFSRFPGLAWRNPLA